MKDIFSNISKENLTADEKSKMLFVLKDFMAKNPVEKTGIVKPIKSPFYSHIFSFISERKVLTGATFLLIFMLTTGTVFGANYSLPGDILYPIKILTESIQSAVAVGVKAKAKVSTTQAVTRLKEAEKLATEGNLTLEKTQELEVKFTEHSESIQQNIKELKKSGDENEANKVLTDFKETVKKQKESISELINTQKINDNSKEALVNIKTHIDKEIEKDEDKTNDDENQERTNRIESRFRTWRDSKKPIEKKVEINL